MLKATCSIALGAGQRCKRQQAMANTRGALRRQRSQVRTGPVAQSRASEQSCKLRGGPKGHVSAPGRAANGKPTRMSERLEILKKARERMVDDRDAFAKTLAAPFDRDKAERARLKFVEIQVLIDAIDRAIAGEQSRPSP